MQCAISSVDTTQQRILWAISFIVALGKLNAAFVNFEPNEDNFALYQTQATALVNDYAAEGALETGSTVTRYNPPGGLADATAMMLFQGASPTSAQGAFYVTLN